MTKQRTRKKSSDDDMLPEYDFSHAVRGRHADRFAEGTNLVVLERDVWEEFPDSERVNEALRK